MIDMGLTSTCFREYAFACYLLGINYTYYTDRIAVPTSRITLVFPSVGICITLGSVCCPQREFGTESPIEIWIATRIDVKRSSRTTRPLVNRSFSPSRAKSVRAYMYMISTVVLA